MKRLSILTYIILALAAGCEHKMPNQAGPGAPPHTHLWLYPDSTIAPGISQQHIHWWGEASEGTVVGYLFASGRALTKAGSAAFLDTVTWQWTVHNDTLISFPLTAHRDTFQVAVRAVDNSFGVALPDTARIRLTPFAYWDKNNNGVYDAGDQTLPGLLAATDPKGATLAFPLISQPPSISFAADPNNPGRPVQQPETTFTVATFAWVGTDPDGDNTVSAYRITLNNPLDSTHWVTLPGNSSVISQPGNLSVITLVVPRERSDTAGSVVTADIYARNYLGRQLIGSIGGLRLDATNTFYVQAQNLAGDRSPIIQLPAAGGRWFVKRPRGRVLLISDYINSDSTAAQRVYENALTNTTLADGSPATFDELNIGRGVSPTAKQNASSGLANPQFGSLVPSFIDPAFIYTLFLYDYVIWYTDQFPTIPLARVTLFPYYTTRFDGRRGRVIFSTSFASDPDPSGLLKDFAPIDSVSSVSLANTRLLPTFGDTRVPGGYQLATDSTAGSDIFPPLRFNAVPAIQSVFLRPIYRRADASYIYHIQDDARVPTRYTYMSTLSDLQSCSASGSSVWSCGNNGRILASTDRGQSWVTQKSGVDNTLRQVHFIDADHGWCVGDAGTILRTTDGGSTWQNNSLLPFADVLGVSFRSPSSGIVVGTDGLLLKSSDGGQTWNSARAGFKMTLRSVHFADPNNGVAVGDSGAVVRTSDGGLTWARSNVGFNQALASVSHAGAGLVFALGSNGNLFRSNDGGASWVYQQQLPVAAARSIFFLDALHGWIAGSQFALSPPSNGLLYGTTDGGQTWVFQNTPHGYVNNNFQNLTGVAFLTPGEGVCAGSGGMMIRTADGGASWAFVPKGRLNVAVIDGTSSFIFMAMPLHLLNGDNSSNVTTFLRYVMQTEFAK